MAKGRAKTIYICQQCGAQSLKWVGRCPDCGEWNSMVETVESREASPPLSVLPRAQPQRLSEIPTEGFKRIPVPMEEFSRVLGGGIVPGSVVLIAGDPGIGKSTLLLQVSSLVSQSVGRVLYVSAEESAPQIKNRAERLGISSGELYLLSETDVDAIIDHIHQMEPQLVAIDSIQ
ncbi:MAG TPA: AAA family ATPase, partial [Anaerolineae bacterium]|nr:AAA family ATPase [Anaerolineae bacterium]